jgi:uncharacterized protein (TIRG00374 family)
MRWLNVAKYLGGLLLAVALMAWVLRGTDLHAVMGHIKGVPLPGLIFGLLLASVLNISQSVFRVFRWGVLLEPVRPRIRFRPMFQAVVLGYMTTWIIPGRLGELVRPALLAGRERLPLGACLGSVLADRVLDGLAVVVLFAVGLWIAPPVGGSAEQTATIRGGALMLIVALAIPLALFLAASANRDRLERRLHGKRGVFPWIARSMLAVSRGLDALRNPGLLGRALFQTLVVWLAIAAATWVGLRAAGALIPPAGTLVIMPLLVLGIALPTPGGAGGYHLAMKVGLMGLYGVTEPVAVAAGLLMHLVVVVPVILLGAALLIVDRIPLHDLVQAARQVKDLGHATSEVPADCTMENVP